MGVRGLSTFVDNNHKLLCQHRLHDCKVIIDGNNLMYFLFHHYKVGHVFGGDLDHYARKCKLFFNTLKNCHVTPFVVFDGGYDPDDRKLPTILTRMNERRRAVGLICATGRGTVLPILAVETFRQVLIELEVPHVACAFEADREIAVLAKRWQCPVMSNDSDFFVFNLPGGFVPFDYVNMTLCLYDEETKKESIFSLGSAVSRSQYVYIPVKLYLCEKFYRKYSPNIQMWCLPLLATLMGNDYVDSALLSSFYATIRVPKCSNSKFIVNKTNTKLIAILHWLDCLENGSMAIVEVCEKLCKDTREKLFPLLSQSVEDYYDIESFKGLDLEFFFNRKEILNSEKFPKLLDFRGDTFPEWFVEGLHRCKISPVLQNAAGIQRIILQCQVEILKLPSTYECSRHIRAVTYGILHNKSDMETNNVSSGCEVIEYDRIVKQTKKISVSPVFTIPAFAAFPKLDNIKTITESNKFQFIMATLDVNTKHNPASPDDCSTLILSAVMSYWIRNAQPRVTEHHLTSLLICVILLHVRALRWLDQKVMLGSNPMKPRLFSDLVTAFRNSTEKHISKFMQHVEKHLAKPDHSGKHPRDNLVVHGFSQFQACLYDTIHLLQLLDHPVLLINPSVIFNGTFVYNLCRDLENRSKPDIFVDEILGHGSPLHEWFVAMKTDIIISVKADHLEPTKKVLPSKSKKGRKCVKIETPVEESSEGVEKKAKSNSVKVNCLTDNKFSLLCIEDSEENDSD